MKTAEITFQNYKKKGNPYVRARQYVTLLDGTVYRAEGSGKNRVDARAALQRNIDNRNKFIQTGMKKDNGEVTLQYLFHLPGAAEDHRTVGTECADGCFF